MTKEEHEQRVGQLQEELNKRLPRLGPLLAHFESFTIHQDQIGPTLKQEDIYLMGLLVKVAGAYGTEVKVVGTCHDRIDFDYVPRPRRR
ncbi:MAG TPA: hypothetical protein VD837_17635 [Terriglobales bacterium]|nr:hypothetical protein [Terriglobales bacterium]